MKIGSLFSGIGGLELGLESAGVGHTVWQVEQDPFCRAVLRAHWGEGVEQFDDVLTVGAHNLEWVDVICGGFPCQNISLAGNGSGLDGEQSKLWWEFARVIREMAPRFAVVENVAALTNRGLFAILGTLADLGYDAEWSCVQALDVGAPHERDRLFVIAYMANADSDTRERSRVASTDSGGWRACRSESQNDRSSDGPSCADHARSSREALADADCPGRREHGGSIDIRQEFAATQCSCENVSDAERARCKGRDKRSGEPAAQIRSGASDESERCCEAVANADERRFEELRLEKSRGLESARRRLVDGCSPLRHQYNAASRERAGATESRLGGIAHGFSAWLDGWDSRTPQLAKKGLNRNKRLRALGNAVVPQVAEVIGRKLLEIAERL